MLVNIKSVILIALLPSILFSMIEDHYNARIAVPDSVVYTVQIGSFPAHTASQALARYDSLYSAGHFVYLKRASIRDRGDWIRVRTGLFDNPEEARRFGARINAIYDLDHFITRDTLLIRTQNHNLAIKTPNAIWTRIDGTYVKCFRFDASVLNPQRRNADYYTQPFLSPDNKQVLFEFDQQVHMVNIATLETIRLKMIGTNVTHFDGIANSLPQQSPSGNHIAFIDANIWEAPSDLWLCTGNRISVLIQHSVNTVVKNFRWHPEKDLIFYVYGYGYGAVSVGGDIYVTDLQGNTLKLIESDRDARQEITVDISVDKDAFRYSVAHFDENYSNIIRMEPKKINLKKLESLYESRLNAMQGVDSTRYLMNSD